MKDTILIKIFVLLFMGASLWSCAPLEKVAQNDTEYDDLYYTAADRKVSAELYASNNPNANVNLNNNTDNPTMTFDNQNANVDYVDRYQESRLYAGDSYGAETYYDPSYMGNANAPIIGYTNPYASSAWGMNAWNSPYGMNTWNNPYRRGGFNLRMGFGFGSMMGMNSWNNPWRMSTWNDPWGYNGFNAWNRPWGMNAWNSPWGWGGASRVIIVNNNNRNSQIASSYYGPRYNSGSNNNVISSEDGRIRVRQSRTTTPADGGGEVGGRPAGIAGNSGNNTNSGQRYGTVRSREVSTSSTQGNGVFIPSTRTQNSNVGRTAPTRNTRTSPTYRGSTPTRTSPTYRSSTPTRTSPTYRSSTPTRTSPTYRSTTPSRSSSPSRSTSTPSRSRPPR